VIDIRWFNIIIIIMPRIKRIVHVGGRGWRRVTLMAARRIMTGRHNEREEKEKEEEKGRRARKMPGVVVVVVVQGTRALNVTRTARRLRPCAAGAGTLHRPFLAGHAARLLPPSRRLSNSNHQPRLSLVNCCGDVGFMPALQLKVIHPIL
jgi:hypothetical protein